MIVYLRNRFLYSCTVKVATQVYNVIFLDHFLLDYTKSSYKQRGLSKVTNTTANLPRQLLTTKLSTMHFAMIGSANRKLWVVGKSVSLTYQINMNVEKANA